MREAIIKRLEAIEGRNRHDPMIVLAKDVSTGELAEMPVSECVKRGAEFVKVIRAGSLEELDMILDMAWKEAWRMA